MSDNQSVRSVPQIFVCDTTNPNAEQQLVTYELNHELNKGEVNDDAFTQCQDIQYMPLDKLVDQCNAIVFSPIKEEDLYSDYSDGSSDETSDGSSDESSDESSEETSEATSEATSDETSDVDW